MRKLLGYGYRLSKESITEAIQHYELSTLNKTKESVLRQIEKDKHEYGIISVQSKPRVFRVIIEEVEE